MPVLDQQFGLLLAQPLQQMPGGQLHPLGLVLRQVVLAQQVEKFEFVFAESFPEMALAFLTERLQLGQQFPVMSLGCGGARIVGVNRPLQPLRGFIAQRPVDRWVGRTGLNEGAAL